MKSNGDEGNLITQHIDGSPYSTEKRGRWFQHKNIRKVLIPPRAVRRKNVRPLTYYMTRTVSRTITHMSKRRVAPKTVSEIGRNRITRLMDLSEDAVRKNNPDRARRYVWLARRIGMKTRIGVPKERIYCKKCLIPLIPGVDCRVRLSDHKVVVTCGMCGTIRRTPYLREQRR